MFGQTHLLVTQQGTTAFPTIRTFTDDFTTQDTTKWSGWATGVAATGGQLSITPTGATPGVTTIGMFDARSAITSVELIQPPNQGNGSISAWLVLLPANNGAGLRIGEEGGTLYAQWRAPGAGSWSTYASTSFNATAHKIWRIRESGGTLYYETSSNGISWSVLYGPVATPVDLSAVQVNLQSGFWGTEPTPGTTLFDNVNATYADPPPAPRTFYVDPAGVDTADGLSTGTAWKTIAKLNATSMYPGDAVLFKAGGVWAEALTVSGSGTSAAPITYGSYGTGAQPIIDGGGASGAAGVRKPVEIYGSFITVQDLEVRGSIGNDILINGPDCIVQRCTVRWGAYGIKQGNLGARAQILNNTIVNVNYLITGTTNNDDTGAMGILLSGDSAVVAGNTISGCWSNSPDYGIDGSAIDLYQATNAQIYNNRASECVTFAELGDPTTSNTLIHHNTFTSTLTVAAGLTVHGGAPFGPVAGTQFHHNTVVLTGGTAQCTGVWMDAGTTMDVRNNILVATGSGLTIYAGAAITEAGNVLFGGSYTLTGQTLDATSIVADPRFVANYTDLHLYTNSPAVDRGADLGYTTDLDGVAPAGAGMDSGAYEATVTPVVTTAGTLIAASVAVASLGGYDTATATVAGVGVGTAALAASQTEPGALVGGGVGTAALTGVRTQPSSLAAAGLSTATVAGSDATSGSLSAAGVGTSALTGVRSQPSSLAAAGLSTATVAGSDATSGSLSAAGVGTSALTGASAVAGALASAGSGAATVAGSDATSNALAAAGAGAATVNGYGATAGALTATGSSAGILTGFRGTTTSLTAAGAGAAALVVSQTESGAFTPAGVASAAIAALGSGATSLVANGTGAAAISAAQTVIGGFAPAGVGAATLAGAGTTTGGLAAAGSSSAVLSTQGGATAGFAPVGVSSATVAGSNTTTGALTAGGAGSSTLAGTPTAVNAFSSAGAGGAGLTGSDTTTGTLAAAGAAAGALGAATGAAGSFAPAGIGAAALNGGISEVTSLTANGISSAVLAGWQQLSALANAQATGSAILAGTVGVRAGLTAAGAGGAELAALVNLEVITHTLVLGVITPNTSAAAVLGNGVSGSVVQPVLASQSAVAPSGAVSTIAPQGPARSVVVAVPPALSAVTPVADVRAVLSFQAVMATVHETD